MPVLHSIIHKIDKKPDGNPAILHYSGAELVESQAREDLMHQFNESYNAKTGKAWGFFHAESGAHPFSGWLGKYLTGSDDFVSFSGTAVEHLTRLMEESNLTMGGHALFCHYRQGMTDYLVIALLQESEAVIMADDLTLKPVRRLDLDHIHLAARINLSEWKSNPKSRQYISFIKGKNGRKANEYFRDFIGCQEGVDGPGETRTLIFNLGTDVEPGHADDRAILRLKPSAGYKAAQAIGGRAMSQKDLSDWIEDWNQFLTAADEVGGTMTIAKAIAAVRTITIKAASESDHTVGETSASRSTLDQIEARSKETLPATLLFNVIPFEGLTEQQIQLRVSVITSGAQPVLKLRWVGEEVQRESIAQEFKTVLQDKIGEAAALSLGAFDPK